MLNDTNSTVGDEVDCPKSTKKLNVIIWNVSQYGDLGMVGKYPK
jgi:hypothetical protein